MRRRISTIVRRAGRFHLPRSYQTCIVRGRPQITRWSTNLRSKSRPISSIAEILRWVRKLAACFSLYSCHPGPRAENSNLNCVSPAIFSKIQIVLFFDGSESPWCLRHFVDFDQGNAGGVVRARGRGGVGAGRKRGEDHSVGGVRGKIHQPAARCRRENFGGI